MAITHAFVKVVSYMGEKERKREKEEERENEIKLVNIERVGESFGHHSHLAGCPSSNLAMWLFAIHYFTPPMSDHIVSS